MKIKENRYEKLILFILLFLPILTISTVLDNDSWFLLNHGKYVLENGFPHIEPFTIHENLQFVMQQWLFSVGYWILYTNFGKNGILIGLYLIGIVIIMLIYKLCKELSGNKFYLSVIMTIVSSMPICTWFVVTRPQIFTYIIILVEMICLEKYINCQKIRWLCVLPLLSVLQINFHASMWGLLFAFWLPYIMEVFFNKIRKKNNGNEKLFPLILIVVLMFGAGFINPYGMKSVLYITNSGHPLINEIISEMASPSVKSMVGVFFFAILLGVVLVYVLNKTGEIKMRFLLLLAGTLLLVLFALKAMPYFIIGGVIPLTFHLKNQAHRIKFGKQKNKKKSNFEKIICTIFILLVICAGVNAQIEDYDIDKDFPDCKEAMEFLKKNYAREDVILYLNYDDGGYAEYCGFKTYIDPRAEVFLKKNNGKKDIFEEYIMLERGKLHYKQFLEQYNFTHIMVSDSDLLATYLSYDENYEAIYEDLKYKIYIPINIMEEEDE